MKKNYLRMFMVLIAFIMTISLSAQIPLIDEGFEGITSGVPDDWVVDYDESAATGYSGSLLSTTPSNNWNFYAGDSDHPKCLCFNSYSTRVGAKGILKTPVLDLGPLAQVLTFDWKFGTVKAEANFQVFISTDGGATYTTQLADGLKGQDFWSEEEISLAAYKNQSNVRIVFVATADYGYYRLDFDNVKVVSAPLCAKPINLGVSQLKQTSVRLAWTVADVGNIPSKYHLKVTDVIRGTTIIDNDSLEALDMSTALSGLTANTEYSVLLKSDCRLEQKGFSVWGDALTFKTIGEMVSLPLVENFSTTVGELPEGWFAGGLNASSVKMSTSYSSDTVGSEKSITMAATSDKDAYLATPQINHAANDMEISFKVRSSKNAKFMVGLMSDVSDVSTAIPICMDSILVGSEWVEYVMNTANFSDASTGYHIVIQVPGGESNTFYFDELTVTSIPTCVRPGGNLVISDITDNGATLAWQAHGGNVGNNFQIRYSDGSEERYKLVTSNPSTLTGLAGNTEYTVAVRQICAAGDTSAWGRSAAFTTFCAPLTVTEAAPFMESFEGTDFPPDCWERVILKGVGNWSSYSASSNYSGDPYEYNPYDGAKGAYFSTYTSGNRAILSAPYMNIATDKSHEVRFWMYRHNLSNTYPDVLNVWVNTQQDTVGAVKIGTVHRAIEQSPVVSGQGWYEYTFPIKMAGDVFIMFDAEYRGGSSIRIDKVEVRERPDCLPITEIKLDSMTTSSAHISWELDADATATEWLLEYKLSADADWTSQTVTDNSYVITGLTPNTEYTYNVRVSANCGAQGMSEVKECEIEFHTLCLPVVFPYIENFENDFKEERLSCWTVLRTPSTIYPSVGVYTTTTDMRLLLNMAIASPELTVDTWNGKRISIDVAGTTPFKVGIMTDPTDESTFTEVGVITGTDTKNTYEIDLTSEYSGRYIGIITQDSTSSYVYTNIDNIKVNYIPSCEDIEGLQVSDIISDGAKITIVDSVNSTWDIKYCAVPYVEANATSVAGLTANEYSISGLTSQTQYAVVVRSVCPPDDYGNWSDTIFFETTCEPFDVTVATPFFEGFETGYVDDEPIGGCWTQVDLSGAAVWKVQNSGGAENSASYYEHDAYDGDKNAYLKYGNKDYLIYAMNLKAGKNYYFSCYAVQDVASGSILNVSLSQQAEGGHDGIIIVDGEAVDNGDGDPLNSADYQHFEGYFSVPTDGMYYLRVGSEQTSSPYFTAVDNIEVKEVACAPIEVSTIGVNVTENSASASWVGTDSYFVKVGTGDFDPTTETGTIFNDTVQTPAFNLSGLTPNMTYYYYIQTLCGSSDSEWGARGQFKTHCSDFTLPYVENFDGDASTLSCWNVIGGENLEAAISSSYKISGTKSFKVSGATLTSPTFDVATLVGQQFSSMVYTTQDTVVISVGVAYDLNDVVTSFQPIGEYTLVGKDRWHEIITLFNDLSDPDFADWAGSKNIVVVVSEDYTVYFDDVNIDVVPTCPKVSSPIANNITDQSVEIDWTVMGTETSWELVVSAGNDTVYNQVVTSHPVALTGLASSTDFEYHVRAICSATDTSGVVSNSFKTICKVLYELPFVENFNTLAAYDKKECWIHDGDSYYDWKAYVIDGNPSYGFDVARDYNDYYGYPDPEYYGTLETPTINLAGQTSVTVEFDYQNTYGQQFYLIVKTAAGVRDTVFSNDDEVATFITQRVDLSAYVGSEINLLFYADNTKMTYTYSEYIRIDNINVFVPSSCKRPVAVDLSNIFTNTVTVNLTDTTGATSWDYAVVAPDVDIASVTEFTTVSVDSFQITGLTANTDYALYVRTICGNERSRWTTATRFITACTAMEIPYMYGFEDLTTISDLRCYDILNLKADGTYPSVSSTSYPVNTGGGAVYFSVKDDYVYFVLPEMNANIDTLFMQFYYKMGSADATTGNVELGLMPMSLDVNDFELVEDFDPTTTYTQAEFDFGTSTYTGRNYRIAIRQKCEGTTYAKTLYIDDINIAYRSSCSTPEGINIVSVGSSTIDFTIQDSIGSAWTVAYGHPDTAIANYATMQVTDVNVQLSGLNPVSRYNIMVAADCSGALSRWTTPVEIITTQVLATVPYTLGTFEDAAENANWEIIGDAGSNKFVIGSDVAGIYQGNNALYVSDDNSTYNYDDSSTSKTWAYRTFNLEEGTYNLSYFVKVQGEGTTTIYDYMRAYLVPISEDISEMTSISSTSYGNEKAISLDGGSPILFVDEWTEVVSVVNIEDAGLYNVVFYWKNDGSGGTQGPAAVDNLAVEKLSCEPVMNPLALYIGSDSVSIDMNTANENLIAYEVLMGDYLTDSIGGAVEYTNDTIGVGGLTPTSEYTFSVRVICAAGDTSSWTKYSFSTACDVLPLPYANGFEEDNDVQCVSFVNFEAAGTYPTADFTTTAKYVNSGTSALMMKSSKDTTLYFVLPELDGAIDSLEMSFYYTNEGTTSSNGNLRMGLIPMTLNQEQFIELKEYEIISSTTRVDYSFINSGYTGRNYRIAFAYIGGADNFFVGLDDINVIKRPDVYPAEEVELYAISNTTASFEITDKMSNNQWQVSYAEVGASALTVEVVDNDSFDISGLLPGTDYMLVVNAKSGTKLSEPTDTIYFKTLCDEILIDENNSYTETFEGYTNGATPDCWNVMKSSGIYPSVGEVTNDSVLWMQTGSLAIALPKFTEEVNNLYMEFDAAYNGTSDGGGELIVAYTTSLADVDAIEDVITLTLPKNTDQRYYIDLTVFPDIAEYIVLKTVYDNVSIDSLKVEKAPDCYAPNALVLASLSNNEATIAYNSAPEQTSAEYQLINVATQTVVEQNTSSDNPLILTNLNESTDYAVILRAQCGVNTTSWSDTLYFSTLQTPATVPYANNWEDATENAKWTIVGTGMNQWILGTDTAAQNGGVTSLYVSNDGSSYAYTTDSELSKSWAYRTFYLEPGVYSFSNDIKVDAESTYDRMRPYLVPVSIDLSTATEATTGIISDNGQDGSEMLTWSERIGDFIVKTAGYYNLAIHWKNDGSVGGNPPAAVDNISFDLLTCMPLVGVEVDSVSRFEAFIKVDDMNETPIARQFLVRYSNTAEITQAEIDAARVIPAVAGDSIIELDNLLSGTTQYVSVRTICAVGDTTRWSEEVEFFTVCVPDTLDEMRGLVEGFEDYDDYIAIGGCWTQNNIMGTSNWRTNDGTSYNTTPRTGEMNMVLYEDNRNHMSRDLYLFAGKEYTFEMWARQYNTSSMDASLTLGITPESGTFDTVVHQGLTDGDYQKVSGTYTPSADGVYVFEMRGYVDESTSSYSTNYLSVDDMRFYMDLCSDPEVLGVSNLTANTATLTWVSEAERTNIKLSGAGVVIDTTITVTADTMQFDIEALSPSSSYTVEVTNICGEYRSLPVKVSFMTKCSAYDLPYSEDFSTYAKNDLPSCWDNSEGTRSEGTETNVYLWAVQEETEDAANKVMRFNSYNGGTGDYNILKSPQFNIVDGSYVMSFEYKNPTGGDYSAYLSIDGGETYCDTLFSNVKTLAEWTKVSRVMTDYEGELLTIVWHSYSNNGIGDAYHYMDNLRFAAHGGYKDVTGTVCAGEPYVGYGFNISQQKTNGLDSTLVFEREMLAATAADKDTTVRLTLRVNPTYTIMVEDSFCKGTVYSKGLFLNKTEGGSYVEIYKSSTGCDSTVMLVLTELETEFSVDTVLCEGGSIVIGGEVVTEAGEYTDSLISTVTGCDSIIVYNVTVLPKYYESSATICEGGSYAWQGKTLVDEGRYVDSLVSTTDCDSIIVLNLTVIPTNEVIDTTLCEGKSILFNGDYIDSTGVYTMTVQIEGTECMKTTTLNLTMASRDTILVNDDVCEGEPYYGNGFSDVTITQDTVMYKLETGEDSCRYMTELHLALIETIEEAITVNIAEGETYTFDGNTYSESGTYVGEFKAESTGCDSIVTLTLNVGSVGLGTVEVRELAIAPNPVDALGQATIHRDWTMAEQDGMRLEVLDALGKVLYTTTVTEFPVTVNSLGVVGMYYIRITSGTGETYVGKLIVK